MCQHSMYKHIKALSGCVCVGAVIPFTPYEHTNIRGKWQCWEINCPGKYDILLVDLWLKIHNLPTLQCSLNSCACKTGRELYKQNDITFLNTFSQESSFVSKVYGPLFFFPTQERGTGTAKTFLEIHSMKKKTIWKTIPIFCTKIDTLILLSTNFWSDLIGYLVKPREGKN